MTARRPFGWAVGGGLLGLAAAAVPAHWITGPVAPGDPRELLVGVGIFRVALGLLGGFVVGLGWWSPVRTVVGPPSVPAFPTGGVDRGWLALLALGSLIVRCFHLNSQLWFDEMWMVVDYVRADPGTAWRFYPTDNNHPLYSLLAQASARLLGETPLSLRLPAVGFGVASVYALGSLIQRRVGRVEGLLSAAMLALSFHHVSFSQNARGYTGMLFFAIWALDSFLDAAREGGRRHILRLGVALALGLWCHLSLIFLPLALAVWTGTPWSRARMGPTGWASIAWGFAGGALLTVVAHSVSMPQMIRFFLGGHPPPEEVPAWKNPSWLILETVRSLGIGVWPGLLVVAAGLWVLILGVRRTWRAEPAIAGVFLLAALLSTLVYVGLGRNLWPRLYFFLAGFAVALVVTGGLAAARRAAGRWCSERQVVWLAAGAMLAAGVATLPRAFAAPKQDYEGARRWVLETQEPGSVVATVGLAILPFRDYDPAPFVPVESLAALEAAFQERPGYLISTFPVFMESQQPTLWAAIWDHAQVIKTFPAAIGGGELVIWRVPKIRR